MLRRQAGEDPLISEVELRDLVAEVDDQHHTGMATLDADLAEILHGEGGSSLAASRRRFLKGVGLGGLALTIGQAVVPVSSLLASASAQTATTNPPNEVTAAFAESLELAAVAAYQQAAAKLTTPAVVSAASTFAGHHAQHATAFAALSKGKATGKPNPRLLQTLSAEIHDAASENATIQIAYDMENAAASTYLYALGVLTDKAALELTASILPVESQHAVVLGQALGLAPFTLATGSTDPYAGSGYVPYFVTQDLKVDQAVYPVAQG
jgi:rubrerythrin